MKFRKIINHIVILFFLASLVYLASCDEKATNYQEPPPAPNPYGSGNGKITFIRKQPIEGPVLITISNHQLNDSIVWQVTPACDTSIASSVILPAGNYSVNIAGSIFLCNYDVTVEERVCKIREYTDCSGGYVGCTDITGLWLRTADGPCPNCEGLKVDFRNGFGEVVYTPPGCRFPIGDIKWKDFNLGGCNMLDLARDQYGGSPGYQNANLIFYNRNSFEINSESGVIPYSRISQINDKKISKNTYRNSNIFVPADSNRLQLAR